MAESKVKPECIAFGVSGPALGDILRAKGDVSMLGYIMSDGSKRDNVYPGIFNKVVGVYCQNMNYCAKVCVLHKRHPSNIVVSAPKY